MDGDQALLQGILTGRVSRARGAKALCALRPLAGRAEFLGQLLPAGGRKMRIPANLRTASRAVLTRLNGRAPS